MPVLKASTADAIGLVGGGRARVWVALGTRVRLSFVDVRAAACGPHLLDFRQNERRFWTLARWVPHITTDSFRPGSLRPEFDAPIEDR